MYEQRQVLPVESAGRALEAVLARAVEEPGQPVAVAVVDQDGVLSAFARMDGARPIDADLAVKQAYTAAKAGEIGPFLRRQAARHRVLTDLDPKYVPFRGGARIGTGGEEGGLGGVGVHGRSEDENAALARVGVGAVDSSGAAPLDGLAQRCPVLAQARRAVAAMLKEGAGDPGRPFGVSVVDANGDLIAFGKMQGTRASIASLAVRKAYTAARLGEDSGPLLERLAQEGRRLSDYGDPALAPYIGSVAIRHPTTGRVLGAVGVSGLAGEEDEAIAKIGRSVLGWDRDEGGHS